MTSVICRDANMAADEISSSAGLHAAYRATERNTMAKRAGRTVKLSIFIDRDDLEHLRKRARRLSGGNLSAAITDMIRIAAELEGREALATWLGEGRDELNAGAMNAIRAEWRGAWRRPTRNAP
jgi:hypothetical protein